MKNKLLFLIFGILILCSLTVSAYSNISTVQNITGNVDGGNKISFFHLDDNNTYNVSEVAGVSAFNIELNFSNVTERMGAYYFHLYAWYNGTEGHYIEIQIVNFSDNNWTKIGEIEKESNFTWYNTSITSQDFISNNNISIRIHHYTAGDVTPVTDAFFDYFVLSEAQVLPLVEVYETGKCPIDDLPTTLLYIFIGIFLVIMFVIGEWLRVPIFNVVTGIGIIFYSFPMWGCYFVYGAIILIFGIMVLFWSIRWKWT